MGCNWAELRERLTMSVTVGSRRVVTVQQLLHRWDRSSYSLHRTSRSHLQSCNKSLLLTFRCSTSPELTTANPAHSPLSSPFFPLFLSPLLLLLTSLPLVSSSTVNWVWTPKPGTSPVAVFISFGSCAVYGNHFPPTLAVLLLSR